MLLNETMSVMEVKTFISDRPELAEIEINEWLQQNKVHIHHIGQSQSERNGRFVFVITLFFRSR
jgi:hypothetical protein